MRRSLLARRKDPNLPSCLGPKLSNYIFHFHGSIISYNRYIDDQSTPHKLNIRISSNSTLPTLFSNKSWIRKPLLGGAALASVNDINKGRYRYSWIMQGSPPSKRVTIFHNSSLWYCLRIIHLLWSSLRYFIFVVRVILYIMSFKKLCCPNVLLLSFSKAFYCLARQV